MALRNRYLGTRSNRLPMAPKRTRNVDGARDDAMAYFVAFICRWNPTDALEKSFNELILDAHQWGEARVRAELSAMGLRSIAARSQHAALTSSAEAWYAAGYRMYLLPEAGDSPAALRNRPRTNEALMKRTADARRQLAAVAASTWRRKYAQPLLDEALAACMPPPPPPPPQSRTPAPAATSPATAAQQRSRSLMARVPAAPAAPALPAALERFLAAPAEKLVSAPRPSIREAVAEAFRDQRALRAWDNELSFVTKPAYALHDELRTRGMDCVYGCGPNGASKEVMERAGFRRLAGGGYNTIWIVEKLSAAPWLGDLFGRLVGAALCDGNLVLRTPRHKARWLSFEEAVGEASNMLSTALCGFGPRVAMLSYVRSTVPDSEAGMEGRRAVRYRLFALLERACDTVDKRYAPEAQPVASATESRLYVKALLVCVYQFSHEGFVHLDGTLRNFVDYYPHALLNHAYVDWCVKVIDVDEKAFRRLCPEASTNWRDLFLINLLVVFTFLKLRLGSRWDHRNHWAAVAPSVAHLMRELPQRTTLPSIAFWKGTFDPYEEFPDNDTPEYMACTHQASAAFLLWQMRYYLLRQPFEQCVANYIDVVHSLKAQPREIEIAHNWYNHTYRLDMYPSHCFFRDALRPRPNGKPRLFAGVLYSYLNTPFRDISSKYEQALTPAGQHRCFGAMMSREQILGIVA